MSDKSNSNFNRNRHMGQDHNGQSDSDVHGGEYRKGRLSQMKNHNPQGGDVPNEYLHDSENEEML